MSDERELFDWVDGYLEFVQHTEPPVSYHIWTALGVISGALERKVYMKWGHEVIYPNQYIVLVGPAGLTRKGVALSIGEQFLERLSIPLGSQKLSKEAFYRSMRENIRNFIDGDTGKLEFHSSISTISKELIVFMGSKDSDFLAALTDLYDAHNRWTYETKNAGTDRLIGVCFNMMGGTTPELFGVMLPYEAIGGGWASRTIFVVEQQKGKIDEDPTLHPEDVPLRQKLDRDLERINLLTGEIKFTDNARTDYSTWYLRQEEGLRKGKWPVDDPRFAAYVSRRATHIKKVAMALSASRGDDMLIHREDFQRAKTILEAAEKKMPRAFGGFGRSKFAETTEIIEDYVRHRGTVTRSSTLRRYHREVSAWDLDQIENILHEMRRIRIVIDGKDKYYEWLGERDDESDEGAGEGPGMDSSDITDGEADPEGSSEEASES